MRGTKLFKNTSYNRLMKICSIMEKKKFEKGEFIFKEGEIGDKFYFVKKGKVRVLKDNKLISEMEGVSYFWWIICFINDPLSATIIACTKLVFIY